MADPKALTRSILKTIFKDQRAIRAFEKLFDLIPSNLEALADDVQNTQAEVGIGATRAQQAIDMLLADKDFGAFFDTSTQVASATDTPTLVTFNSTEDSHGIEVDSGVTSRIVVRKSGIYKLEFGVQL